MKIHYVRNMDEVADLALEPPKGGGPGHLA
jgi:hypothetical protein